MIYKSCHENRLTNHGLNILRAYSSPEYSLYVNLFFSTGQSVQWNKGHSNIRKIIFKALKQCPFRKLSIRLICCLGRVYDSLHDHTIYLNLRCILTVLYCKMKSRLRQKVSWMIYPQVTQHWHQFSMGRHCPVSYFAFIWCIL